MSPHQLPMMPAAIAPPGHFEAFLVLLALCTIAYVACLVGTTAQYRAARAEDPASPATRRRRADLELVAGLGGLATIGGWALVAVLVLG